MENLIRRYKRIKKIERIFELAMLKKSVYTGKGKSVPAAFVQNYTAKFLFQQVSAGQWYEKNNI